MSLQSIVELVGTGFEAAGVALLVIGAIVALVSYVSTLARRRGPAKAYAELRRGLGGAILLGLEFLVAGDIIRSVAVAPTLLNIGVLGLLVLIRTFLSWSLEVEINGRWPWDRSRARPPAGGTPDQPQL